MASRSAGGGTILASGIRTRERKERKLYSDDWALGDEEIEGHHTFDLDQKIRAEEFDSCFVKDMTNVEYDLGHVQENGFIWPLLFRDSAKLGIQVPDKDFTINDVRLSVGSRRMLDVMDVNTQKNVEMTMKDWQRYFESQDKDKLLNVISLEFSHTKLESLIEAPTVVRQIDWVERVWPRHLKEAQTEATNVLEDMMYPKVQKYCLMSVRGCYTDFHIDFGGTSVWYHVLRGKKIFWLIPPTERNLQLYEQWVLSGKQSDIFFGDTVVKCGRVELSQGNTFFIPTGWIHAVYTPEDSLVFGGNFLHSFGIEKQLRVAQVEDATHVPSKFRYPFFTEMLWYVLERYVHVLLGRTHLSLPPDEQDKYNKYLASRLKANNNNKVKENGEDENGDKQQDKLDPRNTTIPPEEHQHLTQYELHGLKAIVMYLHALPTSKKCVPELITDPIALIRDVRTVVEKHRYDKAALAKTCKPVLEWWQREPTKFGVKRPLGENTGGGMKRRRRNSDTAKILGLPPNVAKVRHRRVRCKLCESCLREDCRNCVYCSDMVKYGGPGTMKQTCKMKKCTQPMLPSAAVCYECQLDGWSRVLTIPVQKPPANTPNSLFECCVCFKISHLKCISSKFIDADGIVNEDLPNSWECPECVKEGYNKEYKHSRVPGSRGSGAGSDTGMKTPQILSEAEDADVKVKMEAEEKPLSLMKTGDPSSTKAKEEGVGGVAAGPPHMPSWEELQARVLVPLVRPLWVVRPPPPPPDEEEEEEDEEEESGSDGESRPAARDLVPPTLNRAVMLPVFRHLGVGDLGVVMRVCRSWALWATTPTLWTTINLANSTLGRPHLQGLVRRQPTRLDLSWACLTPDQLAWLLARLPQLRHLRLVGQSWPVLVSLSLPYCPALTLLDLSHCEGVTDHTLAALLAAPRTHRPGHRDTTTRLRHLTELHLAGTHVGDEGVRAMVRCLPFLASLDLSECQRVTEAGVGLLAHPSSVVSHSLASLDLRGCHRLAPTCLPALTCLPLLTTLAIYPCSRIPLAAIRVWGLAHDYTLSPDYILTRAPPPPPDQSAPNHSDSDISLSPAPSPSPVPSPLPVQNPLLPTTQKLGHPTVQGSEKTVPGTPQQLDIIKETEGGTAGRRLDTKPEQGMQKTISGKTLSPVPTPRKTEKTEEKRNDENEEPKKEEENMQGKKSNKENEIIDSSPLPKSTTSLPQKSNSSPSIRVSTRRQSRLNDVDTEPGPGPRSSKQGNRKAAEESAKDGSTGSILQKSPASLVEPATRRLAQTTDASKKNTTAIEQSSKPPTASETKKTTVSETKKATASETKKTTTSETKKATASETKKTTASETKKTSSTEKKNTTADVESVSKKLPSAEVEEKKSPINTSEHHSSKHPSPSDIAKSTPLSGVTSRQPSTPEPSKKTTTSPEPGKKTTINADKTSKKTTNNTDQASKKTTVATEPGKKTAMTSDSASKKTLVSERLKKDTTSPAAAETSKRTSSSSPPQAKVPRVGPGVEGTGFRKAGSIQSSGSSPAHASWKKEVVSQLSRKNPTTPLPEATTTKVMTAASTVKPAIRTKTTSTSAITKGSPEAALKKDSTVSEQPAKKNGSTPDQTPKKPSSPLQKEKPKRSSSPVVRKRASPLSGEQNGKNTKEQEQGTEKNESSPGQRGSTKKAQPPEEPESKKPGTSKSKETEQEEAAGKETTGKDAPVTKKDGGVGKKDGGVGKKDGGVGKKEGGVGKKEGGEGKKDGGGVKKDGGVGGGKEAQKKDTPHKQVDNPRDQGPSETAKKNSETKEGGQKEASPKETESRDVGRRERGQKDVGSKEAKDKLSKNKDTDAKSSGSGNKDTKNTDLRDTKVNEGSRKDVKPKEDSERKEFGRKDSGSREASRKDLGRKECDDNSAGKKDGGLRDAGCKDGTQKDVKLKDENQKGSGNKDVVSKDKTTTSADATTKRSETSPSKSSSTLANSQNNTNTTSSSSSHTPHTSKETSTSSEQKSTQNDSSQQQQSSSSLSSSSGQTGGSSRKGSGASPSVAPTTKGSGSTPEDQNSKSKEIEGGVSESTTKRKIGDKKTPGQQSSDSQVSQKNVIITSVEVHHADNYESKMEQETGSSRRPERRQSVRRLKEEQLDTKGDDKRGEKGDRQGTESPKDKRKDSKTREEEMNKITVEESGEKDSKKQSDKKAEEKERKQNASHKRTAEKSQDSSSPRIKQEKDIVTRSTKRLKSEKGTEEKQGDQTKDEDVAMKSSESLTDVRTVSRRGRETRDEKDDPMAEDSQKKDGSSKLPRPGVRREKEKGSERRDEEQQKTGKRARPESEEYMSKLRRKSTDGEVGSADSSSSSSSSYSSFFNTSSSDAIKKEDSVDEKIKSRRRSARDDEGWKAHSEKRQRDDFRDEKRGNHSGDSSEQKPVKYHHQGDGGGETKPAKRKTEDGDEMNSGSNKKSKDGGCGGEEGGKTGRKAETRERSGSRERPERAHRSPRRLSMCQ